MANSQDTQTESVINRRITQVAWIAVGLVAVYVVVMASGWIPSAKAVATPAQGSQLSTNVETTRLFEQINPNDGYNLSISYGDLGPQLLASGVINYEAIGAIYENTGSPLSAEQIEILKNGSDHEIVI